MHCNCIYISIYTGQELLSIEDIARGKLKKPIAILIVSFSY